MLWLILVKNLKFIETSTKNREDREKMAEVQKSLSYKKIEAARINHEAAHEQTKCKMLETYTQLLLVPTGQLSADALAERNLALESLRLTLFPKVCHCQLFFNCSFSCLELLTDNL